MVGADQLRGGEARGFATHLSVLGSGSGSAGVVRAPLRHDVLLDWDVDVGGGETFARSMMTQPARRCNITCVVLLKFGTCNVEHNLIEPPYCWYRRGSALLAA